MGGPSGPMLSAQVAAT
ncbi:DUF6053 domain-containing protein [Lysobacter yananisis]